MNSIKKRNSINFFLLSEVLLPLPFLFLSVGCIESKVNFQKTKLTSEQLKQIVIGQTTQAQVESLLGKPSSQETYNGQFIMNYLYHEPFQDGYLTQSQYDKDSNTFIKTRFYWSRNVLDDTSIFIGKDGKVADIKRLAGFEDTRLRPDYTEVDQIQPGITTQKQVEALMAVPPLVSISLEGNTRESNMWHYNVEPFEYLSVIFDRNGIADEMIKSFKGVTGFPKRINSKKVNLIKEGQTNRQQAESVLGQPQALCRNIQGNFYSYLIRFDRNKEEVYIQYDNNGMVTSLIRKPVIDMKSTLSK